MTTLANEIVLTRRPSGRPTPDDFAMRRVELAPPAVGEVVVRNLWLSVDPYMRLTLSGPKGLHGLTPIGAIPAGGAVGRVVATNSPMFSEGDIVVTLAFGWRDAYVAPATQLALTEPGTGEVQRHLGLYGLTGITAFAGVRRVLKPGPGDVLLVSGAAGAVGCIAAQLARLDGAFVIGTAGTDEKGRWLQDALGIQGFINYRTEDVRARLAQLAPHGIDLFFDNVGGEQLEIAIDAMKPRGHIALCGAIAQYDTDNYRSGPANLFAAIEKHLTVTGFNAGFYYGGAAEIRAELAGLVRSGQLVWQETIADGLASMPELFCNMLGGGNIGKALIKLDHERD